MDRSQIIEMAQIVEHENATVEFKRRFDPTEKGELLEILKDMIAMANSGGGVLLFGVDNSGNVVDGNIEKWKSYDAAKLTDQIEKYTGLQFSDFEFITIDRHGVNTWGILVSAASPPIIFEKPGTYSVGASRQKTAFSQGTMYFRHGAKSETGSNIDVIAAIDHRVNQIRESWLGNIKKVVEAPIGHIAHMIPPDVVVKPDDPNATAIRITDEPDAPAYRLDTPDRDCPYRQTEIVRLVNEQLKGKARINRYDVQVISKVYAIDENKPQFFYKSTFGPKQYSEAFVDWIVKKYRENPNFFRETRMTVRQIRVRKDT